MKYRQEYIEAKTKVKKQRFKKKLLAHLNAGLILMTAGALTGYVVEEYSPQSEVSARTAPSEFLGLVSGYAKQIAADNDLYASVMIAQAALESGWGNSTLSQAPNYNLFGIKGQYNGNSVNKPTLEDDGSGNYYQIQDDFRKYDNYGESLNDYADLLTGNNDPNNWRYDFYSGVRVSNTSSYQDATAYLTGRYATDTSYNSKLNQIIANNNLTQYDSIHNGSVEADTPSEALEGESQTNPQSTGTYVVKAGDGLYRIAVNHGMTVNQLKSLNGITTNMIHPGQSLRVTSLADETHSVEESSNDTNKEVSQETSNNTANGTYNVKSGDSLYGIASKHGMTVATLKSLNALTSDTIHPGQYLKVSGESVSTPVDNTNPEVEVKDEVVTPPTPSTGSGSYTVKAGDGLYRIATNYGMTVSQLKSLNNLNSDLIHPGQVLVVSASTQSTEEPSTDPDISNEQSEPVSSEEVVVSTGTYTVKAGEGLYRIALNHGLSISQLKALNGLSSDLIHPGQVLVVAGNTTQVAETVVVDTLDTTYEVAETVNTTHEVAETVIETIAEPTITSYTVQAGDTLYSISKKMGVSVDQLIASNNGSTTIFIGQIITLN